MRVDIDEYDNRYQHIILWDPKALELVGAYRVSQTAEVALSELYTSSLFRFFSIVF